MDIDWTFIDGFEGGQRKDGYVPQSGRSGVTIATRDLPELKRLGLAPELVALLEPYLGLRRGEAIAALRRRPLHLSREQADSLDRAIRAQIVPRLVRKYDRALGADGIRFAQLPREIQTVIMSIMWQLGTELDDPRPRKGAPRFWKFITQQDWRGAYGELMEFRDQHPTRRRREAAYLKRWLDRQPPAGQDPGPPPDLLPEQ